MAQGRARPHAMDYIDESAGMLKKLLTGDRTVQLPVCCSLSRKARNGTAGI